jgi:outer membrane protein, heavy metal efflux system
MGLTTNFNYLAIGFISLYVLGCTHEPYVQKPLKSSSVINAIKAKNPNTPEFEQFLVQHGYDNNQLPISAWSLEPLTLAAIYHHPTLALAKENYALAKLNAKAASNRENPSINFLFGRTNQANNDINPWSFGFALDIPININDKRAIRTENGNQQVELSKIALSETAWALREQLATDLLLLHETLNAEAISNEMVGLHSTLTSLYQKRLVLGMASSLDVSRTSQQLTLEKQNLLAAQSLIDPTLKTIANHSGMPNHSFSVDQFKFEPVKSLILENNQLLLESNAPIQLQQELLLNRLDIHKSLVNYAITETDLKLEIAKQIPDISLSPGVSFDYGDTIFTLGINTLINLLKNNTVQLNKAKKLRDIEAAQFIVLQSNLIGELAKLHSEFKVSHNQWLAVQASYQQDEFLFLKYQAQFDAGLIDKVALIQAKINLIASKRLLSTSAFQVLKTQLKLQNLIQKPLTILSPNKLSSSQNDE